MKRILSMLLAIVMVVSMIPVAVSAQGTYEEPATAVAGTNTAVLSEENDNSYYYTYTVTAAGTLNISVPDGVEVYELEIGTEQNAVLPAEVKTGDVVTFCLYAEEAGEYTWTLNFEEADVPGSTADNPINLSGDLPLSVGQMENTYTVTIPADTTYYFTSFGLGGLIMTINGGKETAITGTPREAYSWSITNPGEAEAEYVIKVSMPVGTWDNPAKLSTTETNVATIAANGQPYFFTWTATEEGYLTIEMPKYMAWSYTISVNGVQGDEMNTGMDDIEDPANVYVFAGDVVELLVSTYDANNPYAAPAGTLKINASFEGLPGSQGNPYNMEEYEMWTWNDDGTEATATQYVPANTTYYYALIYSGMELYINGVLQGITTGSGWVPQIIPLTGEEGEEYTEFILRLATPAGTMENPAEAVLGLNYAAIEAETQGYFWGYTAQYTGELSIEISGAENWTYVVNNMTSYAYGDTQWSDSDPVVNPYKLDVKEGDEIQIVVNGYDPANPWVAPAAELYVNLSYKAGTVPESPIILEEDYATLENVGTMYYQGMFAGKTVYISGEGEFSVISEGKTIAAVDGSVQLSYPPVMGRPMPNTFAIVGDGEFYVYVETPFGTMENPASAGLGVNEVSVAEGSQGYFMTYIAEYTGNLVVTISGEENWTYVVNNMTSYAYGDTQWSDSDPVVNPYTVAVTEGDEIQIVVNGYDPANPWVAPAANLTVTLDYAERGTVPELPITLGADIVEKTSTGNLYFMGYLDGMVVTIYGEGEYSVVSGEDTYTPDEEGKVEISYPAAQGMMGRPMPKTFQIVGEGTFTVSANYPVGHRENPEMINDLSEIKVSLAEGNTDGYYYAIYNRVATAAFEVTVESATEGVDFDVILNATNSYAQPQLSDDGDNVVSIDMVPNDTVTIHVVSYAQAWGDPNPALEATLSAKIVMPVGSMENPKELMESNIVVIEEGNSQGYFFTWTAKEDGFLTIQMPLYKHWSYVLNNLTAPKYGDMQWSDSDPVLNPYTVEVKAGDEIQLIVSTYDPNSWNIPAGTFAFTAKFAAAVAQIGDVAYGSVEDALAAAENGETVALIADATATNVLVGPGVTLDLNGKTLTAERTASFGGQIIDGTSGKTVIGTGKLVTGKDSLILSVDNAQLPVYNGTGYIFTQSNWNMGHDTTHTGEGFKLVGLPKPTMNVVELLKNGAADNNIKIIVRLSWKSNAGDGISSQDFTFTEEAIQQVYNSNKGNQSDYSQMFYMIITGIEGVEDLTATFVMTSGTHVEIEKPTPLTITE